MRLLSFIHHSIISLPLAFCNLIISSHPFVVVVVAIIIIIIAICP